MCDKIPYPFHRWNSLSIAPLKFGNGEVVSTTFCNECNHLYTLRLKLTHVTKRGPVDQGMKIDKRVQIGRA